MRTSYKLISWLCGVFCYPSLILHKWHLLLNGRWRNRLAARIGISYRNRLPSMNVYYPIFDCSFFGLIEAEEKQMHPTYAIRAIYHWLFVIMCAHTHTLMCLCVWKEIVARTKICDWSFLICCICRSISFLLGHSVAKHVTKSEITAIKSTHIRIERECIGRMSWRIKYFYTYWHFDMRLDVSHTCICTYGQSCTFDWEWACVCVFVFTRFFS